MKPNRPAAIFTVRSSDGGGLVRVTTNPYGGHDIPGDYSPDGTRIVFGRNNPTLNQFALFVVNVDGSGLRQITAWQPDFGSASWSPDGKRIVFSLFLASTGHVDIFTAKADGTDLRQVTNTPQDEEFADWGTHSD